MPTKDPTVPPPVIPVPKKTRGGSTTPEGIPTPMPPTSGTPNWWEAKASSNPLNAFANALLPFMSPEDMRNVATNLSTLPEYEAYKTATYAPAPTTITAETRNRYLSAQRATQALQALDNMRQLTGKSETELGAGYAYLTNVIKTLQRLGGSEGGMSRAQYLEFQKAIGELSAQVQDNYDVQPYASLANYFVSPTFSAGPLINTFQSGDKTYFGRQNKKLFE